MKRRLSAALSMVALLSACGGGDGGSGGGSVSGTPAPSPTPTPVASAGCSLRERQDWVASQMREWYLFPETLPTSLDPTPYTTVDAYLDALTATARAQSKDRYFTYLTSIKGEDAYYDSGASGGFGFRLQTDSSQTRLYVAESFEGAPALAAGVDRGAEVLAIGNDASSLRTISQIAQQDNGSLTNALGPDTAGTSRAFQIRDAAGTRTVVVTKADFALQPVSNRYGAKIIDDGGRKVGYLNLRTFISTADPALRAAFAQFKAGGVTNIIVDLRYNGGGLVSIAELMGNLMGAARATSEVFSYTTFRPEKAANNDTTFFAPQPESIAPTRIAFIGTGGTASASELVIAAAIPYFHSNAALIGTNTYGKPVGQIALDKSACDDRLRVIAFALQNAARQGAYYTGLVGTVEASCQAGDDLTHQLGDPAEASTRSALDYLAGRSCSAITAAASGSTGAQGTTARVPVAARELLIPDRPNTPQREVPGLF